MKHWVCRGRWMLLGLLLAGGLQAQDKLLKTRDAQITLNEQGYYASIQVNQQEILQGKQYPVVSVGTDGKVILPTSMKASGNQLKLTMADGGKITLRYKESDACIRLEAVSVPQQYDVLVFGPVGVKIDDVVGEVVGVAQGDGLAFGMQALNIKTTAGIPDGYRTFPPDSPVPPYFWKGRHRETAAFLPAPPAFPGYSHSFFPSFP